MALKLITVNIETDKHWHRLVPFFEKEQADVLCLQELCEHDIHRLESLGYALVHYRGNQKWDRDQNVIWEGDALFTKLPFKDTGDELYHAGADPLPFFDNTNCDTYNATQRKGVIWATVSKDGVAYRIATTQFTCSDKGLISEDQKKNITKMLAVTDQFPDLVFCGDFNIPRGYNELYDLLTERYIDAVPDDIKTTMDLSLHRVANHPIEGPRIAKYVVDYIFHTKEYRVSNVRQVCGVSDHCAFVADIEKP